MDRNNCALLRCRSETRWQWPIDRKKNEHSDSVDEHSVCRFAAPNHHQQSIQCQLPGWISRGYGRIRGSIFANVSIFQGSDIYPVYTERGTLQKLVLQLMAV